MVLDRAGEWSYFKKFAMIEDMLQWEEGLIRKLFDLEELMAFQREHTFVIERGEDYQYYMRTLEGNFGSSLTPLGALVLGMKQFKKYRNELLPKVEEREC